MAKDRSVARDQLALGQAAGELQMKRNADLAVSAAQMENSWLARQLGAYNLPKELVNILGSFDLMVARGIQSNAYITSQVIDQVKAELMMEIYRSEKRRKGMSRRDVDAAVALALSNGELRRPIPVAFPPIDPPPGTANPNPSYPIAAEDRAGGAGDVLKVTYPVFVDASGIAHTADQADDAIGLAKVVSGEDVIVALPGEILDGFTGLTPAAYYYSKNGGGIALWAALIGDSDCKCIARAVSETAVQILERPVTYKPAVPLL